MFSFAELTVRQLLVCCLLFSLSSLCSGEPNPAEPFTQVPLLARFARDREAAAHLSELAEFSIRLLQWNDTERTPIFELQRRLKAESYRQTALSGGEKHLDAAAASELVSRGFRTLRSPRILLLDLGAKRTVSVVQEPSPVVLLRGELASLPVVLTHTGTDAKLSVTLSITGLDGPSCKFDLSLESGQTRGLFLPIRTGQQAPQSLAVQVVIGDRVERVPIGVRWSEPARWTVRILDAAGSPTPARVYLTGSDGRAYVPVGHRTRITNADYGQPFGGDVYFYAEGEFTAMMPPGEVRVEVVKGMEYAPAEHTVRLEPGAATVMDVRLTKPFDLRREGWYSGDVHIHGNLYDQKTIKPHDALRISKAEDLNVTHLLTCNDVAAHVNDRQYFEGRPHALSEAFYIITWGHEFRAIGVNNHVAFLGLREFLEPAYAGWPGTPFPYDAPPIHDLAKAARAQGAAVTYVHPGLPSQYPVDFALGVAEAIDVLCQRNEDVNTGHWYQLLNCGFRCPISAGTDSFLNVPYHLIAGAGRVYVQVGKELTFDRWMEGYRRGRSFATNAPLLRFSVNGQGPGAEIRSAASTMTLEVKGEAFSHVPMQSMELIINGEVVANQPASEDGSRIQLRRTLDISKSSWVAIRVRGEAHKFVTNDTALYAHSSAVYCELAGRKIRSKSAAQFFIDQIDQLIENVETQGRFERPEDKRRMLELFRRGQDVYRMMMGS